MSGLGPWKPSGVANHYGLDTCPVTGNQRTDKYRQSWSEEEPFDSCPQCKPEGFVPMGTRLRALEAELARADRALS